MTGEVIPLRVDSARELYGEGGVDGLVLGTKFAIASVRAATANSRVVLGVKHFSSKTPGGEGKVFADLAIDLARRSRGVKAFTADGAWRGTHLDQVQSVTGCGVIAPPRYRTKGRGGIMVDGEGYAAQPLPWSRRRSQREAACAGHQLWAAGGTIYEEIITASGDADFIEVTRRQTKRDTSRLKDGREQFQFYARYSLPCGDATHDWWEPLLKTAHDRGCNLTARSIYAWHRPQAPLTSACTACEKTPSH